MLVIKDLVKTYGKSDIRAVDGLSLELKPGEIFGFLGPNGAGKSTTIKCLMGILPYDSGSISICGNDIKTDSISAKSNIGYVPDNHIIYDKLTGMEYINFMADMYGVSLVDRTTRVEYLLTKFNMQDAVNKPMKGYSHGMKQKISVICALIHNPALWVLDEPLTGLDPQAAFELKAMMREHADQGKTVFFSSHVLDVVEKVCDRIAIINKGKLIDIIDLKEFAKTGKSLEQYFLSVTGGVNE